jgi:hypothetical protein
MSANGPPHDILIAPEDEPRSARLAVLGFCMSLGLAAAVALVAWYLFMGMPTTTGHREIAAAGAVPIAAAAGTGPIAIPAAAPANPAVVAAPIANAPPLILRAMARLDPNTPDGTLTVFVVDTNRQVTELEQGLLATNAIRATGGATPVRATVVSAETDPEAFWLALAQSENEPFTVVDLR